MVRDRAVTDARASQLPMQLLALVCGIAAGALLLFLLPFGRMLPGWRGETLHAAFVAAGWMGAGLAVTRGRGLIGVVMYGIGAALAWFLARGIVHSVSPHYGLLPYMGALAGGGIAWLAWVMRRARERRRALWTMLAPSR